MVCMRERERVSQTGGERGSDRLACMYITYTRLILWTRRPTERTVHVYIWQ